MLSRKRARGILFCSFLTFFLFFVEGNVHSYDRGRSVIITWDDSTGTLTVIANNKLQSAEKPTKFKLRPDDVVTFVMKAERSGVRNIDIKSDFLPSNLEPVTFEELKALLDKSRATEPNLDAARELTEDGVSKPESVAQETKGKENQTPKPSAKATANKNVEEPKPAALSSAGTADSTPLPGAYEIPGNKTLIEKRLQVAEKLPAGGRLKVTFYKAPEAKDNKAKTERLVFCFDVKKSYSYFMLSSGLILTNEINPEVSLERTSGQLDGDQGRMIVLKNKGGKQFYNLRPKQAVIQFFNFRLYEGLYATLGIPLNENIFTNPAIGLSWRISPNHDYILSGGLTLHKEKEILASTGFKEGLVVPSSFQKDDIPVDESYCVRLFVGISFRLK